MTIRKIRNRYNHFVFVAGLVKLYELGQTTCKAFTDSDIEDAYQSEIKRQAELPKGKICAYTPEVVRDMLIVAREMSKIEIVDLINQISNEEIFTNPEHPIGWNRLSEIATWGITVACNNGCFEELDEEVQFDDEDREYFDLYQEDDDDDT